MNSDQNIEQIAKQCEAVAYLAHALASVHEDSAKIIRGGFGVPSIVGPRSASIMETLGDILNGMGANDDADAWLYPIFEEAQRLYPCDPALPDMPSLGGGITPVEWLRSIATADRKKQANMRAREGEAIADWIDALICRIEQRKAGV